MFDIQMTSEFALTFIGTVHSIYYYYFYWFHCTVCYVGTYLNINLAWKNL
jgi:hypothetical protein